MLRLSLKVVPRLLLFVPFEDRIEKKFLFHSKIRRWILKIAFILKKITFDMFYCICNEILFSRIFFFLFISIDYFLRGTIKIFLSNYFI